MKRKMHGASSVMQTTAVCGRTTDLVSALDWRITCKRCRQILGLGTLSFVPLPPASNAERSMEALLHKRESLRKRIAALERVFDLACEFCDSNHHLKEAVETVRNLKG